MEVIQLIASWLTDYPDLGHFLQCCSTVHNALQEDAFWKYLCEQRDISTTFEELSSFKVQFDFVSNSLTGQELFIKHAVFRLEWGEPNERYKLSPDKRTATKVWNKYDTRINHFQARDQHWISTLRASTSLTKGKHQWGVRIDVKYAVWLRQILMVHVRDETISPSSTNSAADFDIGIATRRDTGTFETDGWMRQVYVAHFVREKCKQQNERN